MRKFLFCYLVFFCALGCSVFAMTPTYENDAKFTRGVGNCCYYIDGTASGYSSNIVSAANNWEDTGYGWNPIYMTAVSSNYATHMDFYSRTSSQDVNLTGNVLGYTTYWNTDGTLVARRTYSPTYNYFYTEIVFNASNGDSYDAKVAKHEMGHAFGLSHNGSSYSIMYPNMAYISVSTVQQCDHDTINYLY